jgi:cytochrome b translational activator protein CBS2
MPPTYRYRHGIPHHRTTAPSQVISAQKTDQCRSTYPIPIPPATESEVIEAAEVNTTLVKEVEAKSTVHGDVVETDGRTVEGAERPSSQTAVGDCQHEQPVERAAIQGQPEPSSEITRFEDKEPEPYVRLSNKVHVLGFSSHARFLAHAVASVPDRPPVGILTHHHIAMTRWGEENRTLSLYDHRGRPISSTNIPCPEPVFDPRRYLKNLRDTDYLDNILVDTSCNAVLPYLYTLKHRIDRRTTICLLHPGLGLVKRLNEQLFQDPTERPNLILGYSTHKVAKFSDSMYSIRQKLPGQIYLYGVPKSPDSTLDKSSDAYEGMRQTQHLIQLLSSTQGLDVVGLPWVKFLSAKLPRLIFSSVADSISVSLGCKYNQIWPNPHAMVMWEKLLDETLAIVSQIPELQARPKRLHHYTRQSFRKKLQAFLVGQRFNTSPWIKMVRMGIEPPVDYFNGYFVRRAKELGLDHHQNSMAIEMVKARVSARRSELRTDIPLGASPYMVDGDYIGGGQPVPDLEDDLDLEDL